MYKKILYTVAILTLVSCSSKKAIVTTKSRKPNAETTKSTSKTLTTSEVVNRYIENYKDIAMSNMKNFGIPASIILAQGILESGAGQSKLALTANNHFGIKCYTDWKGETSYHDDDSSQECFRKYTNPNESYQDHAKIITKRTRYASLFDLRKGDYKGWAKGLRAAGYATDPKYPEKLISYIESYHLYEYDNKVLGKNYTLDKNQNAPVVTNNKSANQYVVQQGDTLYSISKKYNISVEELKRQNNIFDNAISIGQTIIVK